MATMQNSYSAEYFRVVHPLHDEPEAKRESEGLGPIEMTAAVRISLVVLRAYLLAMGGMLFYHVLDLAGVFHHVR
ncbi:MAG TPA: hypothetical protein VGR47_12805 [Terracidiphilus sp.]|nr:hypothetical protein [Terracidiphilus sp.]